VNLVKLVEAAVEEKMLNEMALRKDLVNLPDIKKTMEELESAGIDLSKYSFDEITSAFFFYLDEILRGESEKHQLEVMKYWKPSGKSSEADANFRAYRAKLMKLLNLGIEEISKILIPNPVSSPGRTERPLRVNTPYVSLKGLKAGEKFDLEQKQGRVKMTKKEDEEK
jgi:hypothetical protein